MQIEMKIEKVISMIQTLTSDPKESAGLKSGTLNQLKRAGVLYEGKVV